MYDLSESLVPTPVRASTSVRQSENQITRESPLIVLKFGGSILTNESTLRLAVHEIYRWRRQGYRVLAVVSAMAGVTDELLGRCHRLAARPSAASVAALVSTGEAQSAAMLGLHLDRAGVPAAVLTPAAFGLKAEGSALDASPTSLSASPLLEMLDQLGVVVVPGFVATHEDGRPCLLGRGGSDLTALFLAHRLGADRCRLVKDVDGLYERDPAAAGPRPQRFSAATWNDALATDGSIVQHKAVRFATKHRIEFELGRLNGARPTRIGRGPASLERSAPAQRRLRTVLLGCGTVGGGVCELLGQLQPFVELVRVAAKNVAPECADIVSPAMLTADPVAAAGEGADLVIEVLGGVDVPHQAVTAALRSGAHVVTANKALLAEHGANLRQLAQEHGRLLRYSAAVGGSMPLLERLETQRGRGVRSLRAILNGTTNYVLDRVAQGSTLADAVRDAQSLGLAEADPSRDLGGLDAADKLAVAVDTIGAGRLPANQVCREPLTQEAIDAATVSRVDGQVLRHVASVVYNGVPTGAVRLCRLDSDDPLAHVTAEGNAAEIEWLDGERDLVYGKGAGRWPTAEAVIADVLEIVRSVESGDRI
ncbi:MAG: homoserine dehydrogenase [Planctomycetaceae bacterium]|nr:homoserine dehydrogenase [Planctomycetaceae bacterium]